MICWIKKIRHAMSSLNDLIRTLCECVERSLNIRTYRASQNSMKLIRYMRHKVEFPSV